jgi:monoamine oxidase
MTEQTKVVIVGGGFSGIAAAKALHQKNIPFLLLEARERLGGRTYTKRLEGNRYVDLGGQWIGPTQDRMYELATEHGISWYATYNEGKNILDLNKKIGSYTGLIPKMDVVSLVNIDYVLKKLERMAKRIPIDKPWTTQASARWDSLTLEAFVRKHCWTKNCYKVVRAGLETVYACELNEVSLLHALFYIRSGTNLNNLLSIEQGAQQHRLAGGMQPLVEKMAIPFQQSIRLNAPVRSIRHEPQGVVVEADGLSVNAQHIILALPPVLIPDIRFEPDLPLRKKQLLQKMSMGIVGKVLALYPKPFWRSHGYSGQVVADEHAPFQTLFDASPAHAETGVLMAFCIADRARDFFSREEADRKKLTLEYFARYFGEEAATPLHYVDHCWANEAWSQGCYAGLYPTGAWTNFQDTLAAPVGPIHFAGTETSKVWYGYIEGAVRAGERAAQEVINSMP